MGLKKNHVSTVKDLKATFFDLFSDHIEELVEMIRLLATDKTIDPVQIETLIFQRIVMLNDTASSVKNVVTDVSHLYSASGIKLKNNKSRVNVSSDIERMQSNNNSVGFPAESNREISTTMSPITNSSVTSNATLETMKQVVSTTAPVVSQPTTVPVISQPTTVPVVSQPTTVPIISQPTTAPVISQPTTVPVISQPTTAPVISQPTTVPVVSQPTTAAPVSNNNEKKVKFVKKSSNKVKAILVTNKQYGKLRNSYASQFNLISANVGNMAVPSREKLESLMKKASSLYKEGKVSEAQALYAEISKMNKQLNKSDSKVLIKAA